MPARMWGGLLQDTVSPMGDMVYFLYYLPFISSVELGSSLFGHDFHHVLQPFVTCHVIKSIYVKLELSLWD
jgi:hypothetical protein